MIKNNQFFFKLDLVLLNGGSKIIKKILYTIIVHLWQYNKGSSQLQMYVLEVDGRQCRNILITSYRTYFFNLYGSMLTNIKFDCNAPFLKSPPFGALNYFFNKSAHFLSKIILMSYNYQL